MTATLQPTEKRLLFNFFQVEVQLVDIYEKVDFEAEESEEETEVLEEKKGE
jgi:hypothetical protein